MSHQVFCAFDIDDVDEEDYVAYMVQFLLKYHADDVRFMMQQVDHFLQYSIEISALTLLDFNVQLGSLVLAHPDPMLLYFDEALRQAQNTLISEDGENSSSYFFKHNVHVRVTDVPMCAEYTKQSVSEIRAADKHKLISVSGTVIRTGSVKLLEYEKEFMCKKCKQRFKVQANISKSARDLIEKPQRCPNQVGECSGTTFEELKPAIPTSAFRNYQELKIQDKVAHLQLGSIPRTILLIVEDDLADVCKAGDDVQVVGTVMQVWRAPRIGMRPTLEMAIRVNNVIISNEQKNTVSVTDELRDEFNRFWAQYKPHNELVGRDIILRSVCPQMHGLYLVKLAVLLTLIGGVAKETSTGKTRGESHLLLVGDPGTGKSQLMKYAAKLSPRYVLTTGIGTTSAGLTAMASKDTGGDWVLEAGALVLADAGVCCIDEFDSIRENDRASIHEAMEQQTLSIAKAGLMCTLNTRTTVIAACNPKGKYDDSVDISTNTALASPLLSRFDIVLVLQDVKNPDWDSSVSEFILNVQDSVDELEQSQLLWSFEKLKTYVAFVKERHPRLSPEASRILGNYYRMQRTKSTGQASARTTLRLLESLIRLAEAHARLMMHDEVMVIDAVFAVLAIDCSVLYSSIMTGGTLHKDFPVDPQEEYLKLEKIVMEKINDGLYGNGDNDDDDDDRESDGEYDNRHDVAHSMHDHDDNSHGIIRRRQHGRMGSRSRTIGIGSQAQRTRQLLGRAKRRRTQVMDDDGKEDEEHHLFHDSPVNMRNREFMRSGRVFNDGTIARGAGRDGAQPPSFHAPQQDTTTLFSTPKRGTNHVRQPRSLQQFEPTEGDDVYDQAIHVPSLQSFTSTQEHYNSAIPNAFRDWQNRRQSTSAQNISGIQSSSVAGRHSMTSELETGNRNSPTARPDMSIMHPLPQQQAKAAPQTLNSIGVRNPNAASTTANISPTTPLQTRQSLSSKQLSQGDSSGQQGGALMGILGDLGFEDED